MRILHVTQPTVAGVPQVVLDLAAAAVAAGHAVTVASPQQDGFRERVLAAGAEWLRWEAERAPGPSVAREVVTLGRGLSSATPDIVHLHASKAGLAGRLSLRGKAPTVFQPHSWSFEAVGGITESAARRWERWAARWTDRIICVSRAERATGERAGVAGPYVVVPNGVDLARWRKASDTARTQEKQSFGVATAHVVVCVGRLSEQKGQDVLLEAWRQLDPPDAELVLVGDGPERARLEHSPPRRVRFIGAASSDEVQRWLTAADIVVLPSRWEGMSLALLEAMATGRSIVATAVAGTEEALGGAGGVVPPDDPSALADALSLRLRDHAARTVEEERSRQRAEAMSLQAATQKVLRLYEEVLEARAAQR